MYPSAITLVVAAAAIGSFAWSVFGAFRSGERTTSGYDTLRLSAVTAWIIQLFILAQAGMAFDSPNYWGGNLLIVVGLLLFWHCVKVTRRRKLTLAFSVDAPEHIYQIGPYGYVRHPFYLSYLLAYFGMAIAANDVWLYLTAVVMYILYYHAARFEEEKFQKSHLAGHYAEYRRSTGMFLPKMRRFSNRRC
ncbi:MAG: isoprenylcysteine carboxylmethyltransferase family protein [Rhodocyclales bacterium]|nr:isoprenylcysteine carboxylmethyltransferase family protein [Rhodocyclales bacterium]